MSQINWAAASDTFPRFVKLLDLPGYRRHVLLGITVSVGGLTESLVSSFFSHLLCCGFHCKLSKIAHHLKILLSTGFNFSNIFLFKSHSMHSTLYLLVTLNTPQSIVSIKLILKEMINERKNEKKMEEKKMIKSDHLDPSFRYITL